ncbi:hypothetical protein ACFC00_40105 [Streptomyces adustus]|uniref:hypothetical protein n=1 Tax=Streptomyces adustus TaxID=1609272 RepID=UPI0035D88A0F
MTITADSFAGRVLAAFSRRSPGFRPPSKGSGLHTRDGSAVSLPAPMPDVPRLHATPQVDPAQVAPAEVDITGPRLVVVTARWKSASPQVRLHYRAELLKIAAFLKVAELRGFNLNFDHSFSRIHHSFPRASPRDLAADLAIEISRGLANVPPEAETAFPGGFATHRRLAHLLREGLGPANPLTLPRSTASTLAVLLDRAQTRSAFLPDLSLAFVRALALTIGLDRALEPDGDHARYCDSAARNLVHAASDFGGTNLSTVDLAEVDLSRITWDSDTVWPTPEWEARIHSASVEDPPGSGVFRVLPEEGRDRSARGSLMPTQ